MGHGNVEIKPANVKNPDIFLLEKDTLKTLSCTSPQQEPLQVCIWEHEQEGGLKQVIYIDEEGIAGKEASQGKIDGISYKNNDSFAQGKCELEIEAEHFKEFGTWFCTLITDDARTFTGEIRVDAGKPLYTLTTTTTTAAPIGRSLEKREFFSHTSVLLHEQRSLKTI